MTARYLAVGMLPPPVGGQAIMFERAVQALRRIGQVDVIDLQAQRNIGEAGALQTRKLWWLLSLVIRQVVPLRLRPRYDVLYYCPAGPNRWGLLKDILLLALLRPRAVRTIYHFHATGLSQFIEAQPGPLRALAERVLFRPQLALRCADVTPDDALGVRAERTRLIANGIPDPRTECQAAGKRDGISVLTYVGALVEEKGVYDLIEVAAELRRRGHAFELNLVGEGTAAERALLTRRARERGLEQVVRLRGVLVGEAKCALLRATDVFVFASFFSSETQPLAVIEAHAMRLPVVAYDWRGLGTIIEHGATGYLVPVHDRAAFADAVEQLFDPDRASRFGARARARYERDFTIDRFEHDLIESLALVQ